MSRRHSLGAPIMSGFDILPPCHILVFYVGLSCRIYK